MKNLHKTLSAGMLLVSLSIASVGAFALDTNVGAISAHHGGTRSHCRSGNNYYYCDGHSAHTHNNSICPYSTSSTSISKSSTSSKSSTTASKYTTKTTIKQVQNVLNDLGYDCGEADGVMGTKTKQALKQYQKDNDLTVNSKIGKTVCKHLGVTVEA